MDSAAWGAVAIPTAAGIALGYAFETLLQPRPRGPSRRERAANAIHIGLWLVIMAVGLAVWRRPWLAAFNGVAGTLLLVAVSRAKSRVLREPFVVHDFDYFLDVLRHPRFYLPFLGIAGVAAAAIAYAGVLWLGMKAEPSLLDKMDGAALATAIAVLAMAGAALLWAGARAAAAPSWDAARDLERLGLAAYLWIYGRAALGSASLAPVPGPFAAPSPTPGGRRPAIVVVQSESFFDARMLYEGVRPEVLREIDALQAGACRRGALRVPAWGANTARTEFAFLAGVGEAELGVHRFNPYRRVARERVPTIASFLKALGYRTVCVHPFEAAFYRRDAVFPRLGFDELVDVGAFGAGDYCGPFVGDAAVARKIGELLDGATQPLFVFAITMENHGPLHLERVESGDVERLYVRPPPPGCEELTVYLRHLANADRMAAALSERLSRHPGGACLAWYGDHVPMMPRAYAATREPDGRTGYFVWTPEGGPGAREDLSVQDLAAVILGCAGVVSGARLAA